MQDVDYRLRREKKNKTTKSDVIHERESLMTEKKNHAHVKA